MGIDAHLIARQTVTNRLGNAITVSANDFVLRVRGEEALAVVNSPDPQQAYYDIVWARGEGDDELEYVCDDYEDQVAVALGEIKWSEAPSRRTVTVNINRDHAQEFWEWCEARKAEGYELEFREY